jgi:hypothetical protein
MGLLGLEMNGPAEVKAVAETLTGRTYKRSRSRPRIAMVEAAGVEPASENVTGQETTCLFQFMPQAFGALRRFPRDVRGPRSERTRNASR